MNAWSTIEDSDAQIFLVAPNGEVVAEFVGDWPHPAQERAKEVVDGLNALVAERARNEKLRAALEEIRLGKVAQDNDFPLGEWAAQAMRYHAIARTALAESKPQEEQSK